MSSRILFDLLPLIFRFALPPDCISLDTSIAKGPDSTFCKVQQTKASIVLVSREWYEVGVAFLYRGVAIRDFMQLLCFLRTLRTSKTVKNPGRFVHSLHISCLVPESAGSKFDTLLQELYVSCPDIRSLTLSGPTVDVQGWFPPAALLTSFPPFITHLRIDQMPNYSLFVLMLDIVGPSLISLKFLFEEYPRSTIRVDSDTSEQQVDLPALQSLFVGTYHPAHLPGNFLSLIVQWHMPCLESLSISDTDFRLSIDEEILPVLSAHGEQLRYLHVGVVHIEDLIKCLGLCPGLRRLGTEAISWLHLDRKGKLESLFHEQLEWIDINHPQSSKQYPNIASQNYKHKDVLTKAQKWTTSERFPCLRGVRHIWFLPTHMRPDIEQFDPARVRRDKDRFKITIWDSTLRHEVGHLIWDGVLKREMVDDFSEVKSQVVLGIAQADEWDSDSGSEWIPSDEDLDLDTSSVVSESDSSVNITDDDSPEYRSEPISFNRIEDVHSLLRDIPDY